MLKFYNKFMNIETSCAYKYLILLCRNGWKPFKYIGKPKIRKRTQNNFFGHGKILWQEITVVWLNVLVSIIHMNWEKDKF